MFGFIILKIHGYCWAFLRLIYSCLHKKVIHFLISIFFLVAALSLIPHYLAKQNVHDINLKMNKE